LRVQSWAADRTYQSLVAVGQGSQDRRTTSEAQTVLDVVFTTDESWVLGLIDHKTQETLQTHVPENKSDVEHS